MKTAHHSLTVLFVLQKNIRRFFEFNFQSYWQCRAQKRILMSVMAFLARYTTSFNYLRTWAQKRQWGKSLTGRFPSNNYLGSVSNWIHLCWLHLFTGPPWDFRSSGVKKDEGPLGANGAEKIQGLEINSRVLLLVLHYEAPWAWNIWYYETSLTLRP